MREILKDKSGSMLILTMIILFFLFSISLVLGEIYRLHSIGAHVEYELQRAVNIAVEEAMKDSWRQDKYGKLDTAKAKADFYDYLTNELALNAAYQKSKDGGIVYTLEFDSVTAIEDPPRLQVTGTAKVKPAFPFLTGDIVIPFDIKSKNARLD